MVPVPHRSTYPVSLEPEKPSARPMTESVLQSHSAQIDAFECSLLETGAGSPAVLPENAQQRRTSVMSATPSPCSDLVLDDPSSAVAEPA